MVVVGWGGLGSYPLLSQAPTQVEVELRLRLSWAVTIDLPETLEYSAVENVAGEGLTVNNITSFAQTHGRSFVV